METEHELKSKLDLIFPHLNERLRRIVVAAEARQLGYGGISKVSRASGLSRPTIHKGLEDLEKSEVVMDRVRQEGGGRQKISEKDPSILMELESLVDPLSRGDPMSPLRWTCKSTRQLAEVLTQKGYVVSHRVVAEMLRELGYSLQANVKVREGTNHPDRDAQFRYLNDQVNRYLKGKHPVISVDTKKKELVGNYKNGGREWQPQGEPVEVNVHDFPSAGSGKAIPYGIYDVGKNLGWVNVGCDHDTASFAVSSIRHWWVGMGSEIYPKAKKLLICADSGGSNGYRVKLWKVELQNFANEFGVEVTVCHLPPGTSKWNKIEHRLFSHISMNWRGRPLISHEVIVDLIGSTTTKTGLKVKAKLDASEYPLKTKIEEETMAELNMKAHEFHGDWNYTIRPNK